MAIAPIGPLAWAPPCAAGVALEKEKKKKKKKRIHKIAAKFHVKLLNKAMGF